MEHLDASGRADWPLCAPQGTAGTWKGVGPLPSGRAARHPANGGPWVPGAPRCGVLEDAWGHFVAGEGGGNSGVAALADHSSANVRAPSSF